MSDPKDFWEKRYAEATSLWSGNVNQTLAETVASLPPGRALDLGCGEGGDVIWLAEQGWEATGIDISETAIERAKKNAAKRELSNTQANFLVANLSTWAPERKTQFDLAVASFFQSPIELNRQKVFHTVMKHIAKHGHLLLITHVEPPLEERIPGHEHTEHRQNKHRFSDPEQELALLNLDDTKWRTIKAEVVKRAVKDDAKHQHFLYDGVVLVQRM